MEKMPGEDENKRKRENQKKKQQLPSHMSRERGHQRYWQPARGILRIKLLRKPKRKTFRCIRIISWQNTLSRLEIGDMIPPELYEVVAEILVFVDDMDKLRSKLE